jgi:DNA-binding NarL/FixJ family response regulator
MLQNQVRALDAESRRERPAVAGTLTAQELRIAQIVAEGATNKEIATQLFLSIKTVEVHLGHIFTKLGVRSRTELAAYLLRSKSPEDVAQGDEGDDPLLVLSPLRLARRRESVG